jgi:hypothetical protein
MHSTIYVFEGEPLLGVPTMDSVLAPKMPGDADGDNQGDHCA